MQRQRQVQGVVVVSVEIRQGNARFVDGWFDCHRAGQYERGAALWGKCGQAAKVPAKSWTAQETQRPKQCIGEILIVERVPVAPAIDTVLSWNTVQQIVARMSHSIQL